MRTTRSREIFFDEIKMKVFVENVPSIFTALWVAQNDAGQDLKEWLQIKLKIGVTNEEVSQTIKNQYNRFLDFEPDGNLYTRLEHFFVQNFAIMSQQRQDRVSFSYKSENWSNMVFLKKRGDEMEYMRTNIKEMLPLLAKNDCLIKLPLDEICRIFGKTAPDGELCDDTHADWQNHLQMNIMVYRETEGRINTLKELISVGRKYYEETISLLANQEAYEVHFSIYTSIYMYIYLCIHIYIYLDIYMSIDSSIYLYIYLSIYMSIDSSIYMSIDLSICLSIYRSIDSSIYI